MSIIEQTNQEKLCWDKLHQTPTTQLKYKACQIIMDGSWRHMTSSCLCSDLQSSPLKQPLDFETSTSFNLQIDARNPEQLQKGLQYGAESSTSVTVELTDVDEAPEFSTEVREVTVFENATKGTVLLTVEAKDPEGKEIG